jgi:hypothetical protein
MLNSLASVFSVSCAQRTRPQVKHDFTRPQGAGRNHENGVNTIGTNSESDRDREEWKVPFVIR